VRNKIDKDLKRIYFYMVDRRVLKEVPAPPDGLLLFARRLSNSRVDRGKGGDEASS
jgi:hypothetical protein